MSRNIVVILGDGHGKTTPGNRSPAFEQDIVIDGRKFKKGYQFVENSFNCPVCDKIEVLLKGLAIDCIQVAPSHEDISLRERVKREHKYHDEAKAAGKQPIFISIHANAHTEEWNNASGIETFCHPNSPSGKKLAKEIQDRVTKATGLKDRGVKTSPVFYIIRKSKSPSVLFEGGFMTNWEEVQKLASKDFQNKVATSIVEAILKYCEK